MITSTLSSFAIMNSESHARLAQNATSGRVLALSKQQTDTTRTSAAILVTIIKISFFIYCCYIGITIVFLKISWYLGSLLHSLTSSNSFPVVFCLFILDTLPKPIMRSDNEDSFISSFPILILFHFSCFIAVWPSSKTSNGTGESGHSSHSWS